MAIKRRTSPVRQVSLAPGHFSFCGTVRILKTNKQTKEKRGLQMILKVLSSNLLCVVGQSLERGLRQFPLDNEGLFIVV